MKEITDKLDFIKIKNFCSVKETAKKRKDKSLTRIKYLQVISDKGLLPKVYKELLKYNSKKNQKA